MNTVPLTLQKSTQDYNLSEFKAISLFTVKSVFSLDNRNIVTCPMTPHTANRWHSTQEKGLRNYRNICEYPFAKDVGISQETQRLQL